MPDNDGELIPADLAAFTQGRLDGNEPATADALTAALVAVRRFCGWHVTPVRTADPFIVDGPGARLLVLPTLRLTAITELAEDGTALDVDADFAFSRRGLVRKSNGCFWSGRFGAVVGKMTHGFDAAPDWQAAVLSFADRSSLALAGVAGRPTVVGPFQYGTQAMADGSAFSVTERSVLEQYRLESPA